MTKKKVPAVDESGDTFRESRPDSHVNCRAVGHRWNIVGGALALSRTSGVAFTCANCQTTRYDVRARRTGELVARKYAYADGYQKPKSSGSVTKREWWTELVRRSTVPKKEVPEEVGATLSTMAKRVLDPPKG